MARLIKRIACQNSFPLSKATLLAYLPPKPIVGQTGINPTINAPPSAQGLLSSLSDSQWDILSFDPISRHVCVIIYNTNMEDDVAPTGEVIKGKLQYSQGAVLTFTLVPPISTK